MKRVLGLVVCLGAIAPVSSAWAECTGQAVVIQPQSGAPMESFKTWLAKQEDAPSDPELYAADINNDGKEEFIVTTFEGSGGYLHMEVYAPSAEASFRHLRDAPPPPGGKPVEGGWYSSSYTDPVTNKTALFTRLCGKTYMSFIGKTGHGSRDSFLWDARGTHPACDAPWTAYIRAEFKTAYDRKDYEQASTGLSEFSMQCTPELDAETRAWIDNDLSITQYHLGDTQRCLEYAARAKTHPKVQSAAQYNEKLCKKAEANLPSDFTWLLDKSLTNTNQLVWARPFPATLRAIVPNLKQGEPQRLREFVKEGMSGPGDDKQVEAERYVTASGCVAHACNVKAMMWVDVKDRIGLVAHNEAPDLLKVGSCYFVVGSRQVGSKQIPAPFWTAFKHWRAGDDSDEAKNPKACVDFIAPDGTVSRITPP